MVWVRAPTCKRRSFWVSVEWDGGRECFVALLERSFKSRNHQWFVVPSSLQPLWPSLLTDLSSLSMSLCLWAARTTGHPPDGQWRPKLSEEFQSVDATGPFSRAPPAPSMRPTAGTAGCTGVSPHLERRVQLPTSASPVSSVLQVRSNSQCLQANTQPATWGNFVWS